MVRPEVVAHEKKDVGPDQFEQPFCVVAGISGQIKDGGGIDDTSVTSHNR